MAYKANKMEIICVGTPSYRIRATQNVTKRPFDEVTKRDKHTVCSEN